MLTLPDSLRRSYLRAFWLLLSMIGMGILFLLNSFLPTSKSLVSGQLVIFALLAVGMVWPEVASLPYRIWNRLVPLICRLVQTCLLAIVYVLVFTTVGSTGSKLVLKGEGQRSGWLHWSLNLGTVVETKKHSRSWIINYLKWAVKSGNWWTCVLLPFWLSISAAEIEREESPPTSTYTLY